MVDTNTNPNIVDYPIPSNDDSVKCIRLIMDYISENISSINDKDKEEENDSIVDSSNNEVKPIDKSLGNKEVAE